MISAHFNLCLSDQVILLPQPPELLELQMGFHHVGQACLEFLTSDDPPALIFQSAEITGVSHCIQPRTVFPKIEMGFLYVGQAGLELLTSGDLPALASQSAGITGMSHRTWLIMAFISHTLCLCCSGCSVVAPSWLNAASTSQAQNNSLTSASPVARTTAIPSCRPSLNSHFADEEVHNENAWAQGGEQHSQG
ncbi:hypothetical protein AAY473_020369 [Plecturocebus cupreus]